jgi:hypothetical protein
MKKRRRSYPPTVDATAWLAEQHRKDPGLRARIDAKIAEMEAAERAHARRARKRSGAAGGSVRSNRTPK